jgi:hypothetical protein
MVHDHAPGNEQIGAENVAWRGYTSGTRVYFPSNRRGGAGQAFGGGGAHKLLRYQAAMDTSLGWRTSHVDTIKNVFCEHGDGRRKGNQAQLAVSAKHSGYFERRSPEMRLRADRFVHQRRGTVVRQSRSVCSMCWPQGCCMKPGPCVSREFVALGLQAGRLLTTSGNGADGRPHAIRAIHPCESLLFRRACAWDG